MGSKLVLLHSTPLLPTGAEHRLVSNSTTWSSSCRLSFCYNLPFNVSIRFLNALTSHCTTLSRVKQFNECKDGCTMRPTYPRFILDLRLPHFGRKHEFYSVDRFGTFSNRHPLGRHCSSPYS